VKQEDIEDLLEILNDPLIRQHHAPITRQSFTLSARLDAARHEYDQARRQRMQ
jgi:hypothetical protein